MVVLIPKGGDKDFRGIGMVEFLWKATPGIINWRIAVSIMYHDSLHGLLTGRGMETTTLEANLLYQLTAMVEEVLHTVLLGIHKVYNALDRDWCLDTLVG